ncbi:MAG: helix-turn-helix domain-containing protein [Candidatus Marinimicrobia bacterium]|nr:helix-turn-helix domain-containing protein [Candidatus Neomarinimicrobiota bacterium]
MVRKLFQEIILRLDKIYNAVYKVSSPYLSVDEAAKYLKISESSVRRLLKNGRIPYQRISIGNKGKSTTTKILISKKQIDLFVFYGSSENISKRDAEKIKQWIW